MPGGRPTKLSAEKIALAAKVAKLGATDLEIADCLGISVATLYNWKNTSPQFLEALNAGKEIADEAVQKSLYRRATGYTHTAVKIFMPAGAKEPVYAEYQENIPPDPTSMIFWLKNRQPEAWREGYTHKTDVNVTVSDRRSRVEEEVAAILSPEPKRPTNGVVH